MGQMETTITKSPKNHSKPQLNPDCWEPRTAPAPPPLHLVPYRTRHVHPSTRASRPDARPRAQSAFRAEPSAATWARASTAQGPRHCGAGGRARSRPGEFLLVPFFWGGGGGGGVVWFGVKTFFGVGTAYTSTSHKVRCLDSPILRRGRAPFV